MLNHRNLLEYVVHRRFYIWTGDICSIVYECTDEEGDKVKKRLHSGTLKECERFLTEAKKQLKEWLEKALIITEGESPGEPPTASTVLAKLPKPKMRKKVKPKEVPVKSPRITITSTDSFDPEQR